MYVKVKQLQLSGNRAFGSALHFNARWLRYVLCSLTFKKKRILQSESTYEFFMILRKKKLSRHIINFFVFCNRDGLLCEAGSRLLHVIHMNVRLQTADTVYPV